VADEDTVFVETSLKFWERLALEVGAKLVSAEAHRVIGPKDIGRKVYTPIFERKHPDGTVARG
jgi:hypothetical protein